MIKSYGDCPKNPIDNPGETFGVFAYNARIFPDSPSIYRVYSKVELNDLSSFVCSLSNPGLLRNCAGLIEATTGIAGAGLANIAYYALMNGPIKISSWWNNPAPPSCPQADPLSVPDLSLYSYVQVNNYFLEDIYFNGVALAPFDPFDPSTFRRFPLVPYFAGCGNGDQSNYAGVKQETIISLRP